jgi:hypothetical protein
MRSRGFVICGMAMIFSIGMLNAGQKNENWLDKPYTQWDQKEVSELFNKSAWAQTKSFRGQAANISRTGAARAGQHGTVTDMGAGPNTTGSFGTGGAGANAPSASRSGSGGGARTGGAGANAPSASRSGSGGGARTGSTTEGVDVPEFSFTARLFSAQPIRDAYVRMLQIMNHYDGLPPDKQHAFDQGLDRFLHADFSQHVVIALSYQTNDPIAQRNMDKWFNTQTVDTLKQNAYLFSPIAGQLELVKYFPAQGEFGAEFVFPRLFKGEPILQPGAGKMRFQLSYQPQIHQIMYIDFDSKEMTYKDQFSY